nr:ankyrin repeat domain-containing protein 42-like [Procambarus clarkii]
MLYMIALMLGDITEWGFKVDFFAKVDLFDFRAALPCPSDVSLPLFPNTIIDTVLCSVPYYASRGRTAVHWAALRGQVSALQQLFDKSCDIHARVDGKSNALHFGAASGELEAVEWLVQAGVNKNQKDKDNKTPSDIAKKKGFKDISAFLKDKNSTKSSDVRQGESMKKKNPDFSRLEDQLNRLESEKGTYAEDLERKNSEISKFQEQLRRLEYEKRHLEDVLREMELNPRPRQLDVSLSETQHQLQIITLQNKEYKKILVR